jgi:hypothetical protein
MLKDEEYADKITKRQESAGAFGISLVVVGPTDMHSLRAIFAHQLQKVIRSHDQSPLAASRVMNAQNSQVRTRLALARIG